MKNTRRIYLDHAATSPVRPEVLEAMWPVFTELVGNASSLHSAGQASKRALEQSRRTVAHLLGADPKEIYFTSGGTASDNLAILGVAYAHRARGRHIITSAIEHHAVLHTCHHLEAAGWEVTYLPVDETGLVDLDALKRSLRDDTVLISIMLANNEVGTIQPLAEVAALARERGILVHTDAVQAMGKIPVDVNALGVDLLSLTAHKFNGPKGAGALYVRQGTRIAPLNYGGHQERELVPGTENIPGIVGLATAFKLAIEELGSETQKLTALRDRLEAGIREVIPDARLNGHPQQRLPNILNMSLPYVEGESLLLALDTRGIAVSTGSACSAGSSDPSHVLLAMGLERSLAEASLRFSLGWGNTVEDVDCTVQALQEIVPRLRELSPLYHAARKA